MISGGIDFFKTTWITDFDKRQKITMTVDDNTYIIKYEKTALTINGYTVTVTLWKKVLDGQEVTLTNDIGDTVIVSIVRGNIMFDNKKLTGGMRVLTSISSTQAFDFNNLGGFNGDYLDKNGKKFINIFNHTIN